MPAENFIAEPYRGLPDDAERLAAIRGQLDSEGVVELTEFLTPEGHGLLKEQILDLESKATSSTAASHKKYALKGEHLNETVVGEIARSDYILGVVNGFLDPWVASDPIPHRGDRARDQHHARPGDITAYHFDGTYLNMILPVVVPKITGERRGQLIAYPNIRSFKRTFWDTKIVPGLARIKPLHRLFRRREVDYQERGAYLFYGYRTLHGVESPAEAGLRAVTNLTVGARRF